MQYSQLTTDRLITVVSTVIAVVAHIVIIYTASIGTGELV